MNKKTLTLGDDSIIFGVCSGLSNYFNIDVSVIRCLFIFSVIYFNIGILPYLILTLIIPENKIKGTKE